MHPHAMAERTRPIRTQKAGACALCLAQRDLCKSHIIPEFAYKPLYDDDHKMIAFEPSEVDQPWKEQKGFRDRLLCSQCESFLNKSYEDPFNQFWFTRRILDGRPDGEAALLNGIPYAAFKLFHLSVLWRASVCQNPVFGRVDLGPHNDRIRRMLLAGDPGRHTDYPIICAMVTNESRPALNLITSPLRLRYEGHTGYLFTFAGCQWLYYASSHSHPKIELLSLKEDGTLQVFRRDVAEVFRSYRIRTRRGAG